MNLLRVCLFAFGVLWISNPAFTQEKANAPAKADTLKLSVAQALQFALENNQSILNANLDIEAAKKKVWETTAIGLPQVTGKIGYQYTPELTAISGFNSLFGWMHDADQALNTLQPGNPAFGYIPAPGPPADPDDMKWSLAGTVTFSQLIFSGSYIVGLQSAKVYKSLSELNQVKSKHDVLESVNNSYISVLIARENKLILDTTYNLLNKTYADMKAMNGAGFIEETDLDQMQITVSTLKSSLDLITRLADISEKLLKIQLGMSLETPLVLTDSLAPIINTLTIEQLVAADFVLENNVDYKMLDAQVKSYALILKLRKSEFLPDLAAFYQYQKEFNDKAFTFTPPHAIGVQMNIPIFGSGQKLSRVSQAKIDLLKAQNTREQMANNLMLDYYSSKSTLLNAYDKFNTESVNMKLARKIYDRALVKYTNGVISSTDLTQIQNQYLTAQSSYYQSLQDLIAAKSKLQKILTNSN